MTEDRYAEKAGNRDVVLARMRKEAERVLSRYVFDVYEMVYIGWSDTLTYKIRTRDQGDYLLRFHSSRQTFTEIASELALLEALKASGFTVPTGVRDRYGVQVSKLELDEGIDLHFTTLMKWVDGETMSGKLTEIQARRIGVLLGKLHQFSLSFVPPAGFTRPSWGEGSFNEAMDRLARYGHHFLTERELAFYELAADSIRAAYRELETSRAEAGLIHADLHIGNLVFVGDDPRPIDFGRCGYGYFLYDIAAILLGLGPECRRQLLHGYYGVRPAGKQDVKGLECFFIMTMLENCAHHASNPLEWEGLKEELPFALAYVEAYLHGRPFLFQPVQPQPGG